MFVKINGEHEQASYPVTFKVKSFHITFISDASLKDLVNELREVTDWFQLGLCLKVPLSVLRTIQQENKEDTHKCREEMLRAWMKQEIPMWSTIVKALLDMEMTDLALKIASKDFGKSNCSYI